MSQSEQTIFQMICDTLKGPMKPFTYMAMVFGLVFTAAFFYSGWQFMGAESVNDHFHWAVAVLLSALFIAMLKIWFWMLLMKNAIIRELKK